MKQLGSIMRAEDRVRYCIVEAGPVRQCMAPDVGPQEVLSVDGGRDVSQDCLNVAFNSVLPLLIGCGCFVAALAVFVECDAFL